MYRRLLTILLAGICVTASAQATSFPGAAFQGSAPFSRASALLGLAASGCSRGVGMLSSSLWGGFSLRIAPASSQQQAELAPCQAEIRDSHGRVVFQTGNWAVRLHPITGSDLNHDGSPDVVLEAYSGGVHCCWTYSFVSLSNPPRLLAEVMNEARFDFRRGTKSTEVWTRDGGFDYFETSHVFSPMPRLVVHLRGRQWFNASSAHLRDYDRQILEARRRLTPQMIREFQNYKAGNLFAPEFDRTKGLVLSIVVAYLYSGREALAWAELQNMWPIADRARIKAAILQARDHGLLSRLHPPAHRSALRAEWLQLAPQRAPAASQSSPFGR